MNERTFPYEIATADPEALVKAPINPNDPWVIPLVDGKYPDEVSCDDSRVMSAIHALDHCNPSQTIHSYLEMDNGDLWFWPKDHPNAGDHIHYWRRAENPRHGYGGRTIVFKIGEEDHDWISVKGPWHSNSGALLNNTKVDLTCNHLTWGVIGYERRQDKTLMGVITDIAYMDSRPVVGTFNRLADIAQFIADDSKKRVVMYMASVGGSRAGWIDPTVK